MLVHAISVPRAGQCTFRQYNDLALPAQHFANLPNEFGGRADIWLGDVVNAADRGAISDRKRDGQAHVPSTAPASGLRSALSGSQPGRRPSVSDTGTRGAPGRRARIPRRRIVAGNSGSL